MSERTVIAHNFKLMFSAKSGGMVALLNTESMGGNAGTEMINGMRYVCSGANFYFNKKTGEIVEFTNAVGWQEKGFGEGCFRTCIMPFDEMRRLEKEGVLTPEMAAPRIINLIIKDNASRKAQKILKDSMKVYNAVVEARIAA